MFGHLSALIIQEFLLDAVDVHGFFVGGADDFGIEPGIRVLVHAFIVFPVAALVVGRDIEDDLAAGMDGAMGQGPGC